MTDEEFMALYRKVDAETDLSEDSRTVDEAVGRLIGQTADEVCSRYIAFMDHDI